MEYLSYSAHSTFQRFNFAEMPLHNTHRNMGEVAQIGGGTRQDDHFLAAMGQQLGQSASEEAAGSGNKDGHGL